MRTDLFGNNYQEADEVECGGRGIVKKSVLKQEYLVREAAIVPKELDADDRYRKLHAAVQSIYRNIPQPQFAKEIHEHAERLKRNF